MESARFVILGAGFTGSRVARLLESQGHSVVALRSAEFDVLDPATHHKLRGVLSPNTRALHSIPVLRTAAGYKPTMPVLGPLLGRVAARVVYLSTTGVYGDAHDVNEQTPIAPRNEREQLRADEEHAIQRGPWSSLVLRPAAIYGPGRGIHESMRAGTYRMIGEGSNFISRIHVDDLAAIAAAALVSDLEGSFPVADLAPCPAHEIAAYCAQRFGYAMPASDDTLPNDDTRRSDRRVDGRAIAQRLGITLQYPTYREGLET